MAQQHPATPSAEAARGVRCLEGYLMRQAEVAEARRAAEGRAAPPSGVRWPPGCRRRCRPA
jgi:hypothetical protein